MKAPITPLSFFKILAFLSKTNHNLLISWHISYWGMGIIEKAREIAGIIERQDEICIVTHCDADGITGAAIAKKALDEIGIKCEIKVVRYLSRKILQGVDKFTWFIDLGNGNIAGINGNAVITDHHFSNEYHERALNPFYYGIDGETEISAAGLAYLVASNFSDFDATLAIMGAIGDLQDLRFGRLTGINRQLLKNSKVEIKKDIRIYGRKKPLYKMIAYATDPVIPGIFKRVRNAIGFLSRIDIDYKKSWNECSREEKKKILSELIKILVTKGFSYDYITRIFGEVYELDGEDVREYATLLNSIGKYGYGMEAIKMCIEEKFDGKNLLKKHRSKICNYIEYAKKKLDEYKGIYYFHGGNYIMDTVVGTVAGMILREEDFSTPLLAFAENEEGIKVSARAPYNLVEKGLNLSIAMKNAAEMLGGNGGGHKAAAGAIIPKGMEERFLQIFDAEIRNQLTL